MDHGLSHSPPDVQEPTRLILHGLSTVFGALGRSFLCLDAGFHIMHAEGLEGLVGAPVSDRLLGRPVADLLGAELFGPEDGMLRRALTLGERREGWGTTLRTADGDPRHVSVTAAPLDHPPGSPCDPRVAYLVVLRPAEDSDAADSQATVFFAGMIARSPAMRRIFQMIENLGESSATVLINGESGTGKELVARAVHRFSPAASGPFVAVNCGALPEDLLESELFGHVRGSFTGATRDRQGRFEAAQGGTLLLDEVGELPLRLQVKLLRVLQERSFERVGESQSRATDARVIAATNVDLGRAVADGAFRKDLFYRLRVLPVELPPLRDRREDVEPLARYLLSRVGTRHHRALRLGPEALSALMRYPWPGNVRELENALEYAVALCQGQTVHARDLPPEIVEADHSSTPSVDREPARQVPTTQLPCEEERLRAALEEYRWRRADAARALGMSRTTLWRKMREYGLIE